MVILLTLLVSWMEDAGPVRDNLQCIEFFAGVGRIAALARGVGLRAAAYDIQYGEGPQCKPGARSVMDLNSNAGLVLAIKLVLRGHFNQLAAFFAVCCSSFVPVNRGTGKRDILVPEGDERVLSVRKSNKLLTRTLAEQIC